MPNNSVRGMVRMIRKGFFFYVGKSGSVANYVHVRDVIQGLICCAFNPSSKGEIFNLSCDCAFESMVEQISQSLKVSSPRVRLPDALVRMVANLLQSISASPLSSSRVNALINRTRYPSTKIEQVLKFKFQNQMPRAFEELVVNWSKD
jgi:nucleoside-diphosphate-sugar epimerase